jgi:hypothetical protein
MSRLVEREAACKICGTQFTYTRVNGAGGTTREICDECLIANGSGKRKLTISLSKADYQLLTEIQLHLSIDASEALRTAIRVYNSLLKTQI